MTEQTPAQDPNENQEQSLPQVSELDVLKDRARMMGIVFSNNIGVDALKAKIEAKLSGVPELKDESSEQQSNPLEQPEAQAPAPKQLTLREQMMQRELALVRCRIVNLDPKKKDLPGEIFVVANDIIGTVRKYVPYGEGSENGYHIPTIIYNDLLSRRFLHIRTRRDRLTGTNSVDQSWAQEFSIEVLPPLTLDEIKQLAQAQIAAGSI